MAIYELITDEPWGNSNVALFARRRSDGKRVRLDVKDFGPYFFVHESEVDRARAMKPEGSNGDIDVVRDVQEGFTTIFTSDEYPSYTGEDDMAYQDIARVEVEKPGQVGWLRDKFDFTWESDVPFDFRYRVDVGIQEVWEIPDEMHTEVGTNRYEVPWWSVEPLSEEESEIPRRNAYYDIEVAGDDHLDPLECDEFTDPIVAITIYDSYEDVLRTWTWRDGFDNETRMDIYENEVQDELVDWEIRRFGSEQQMLGNFVDHFTTVGYDILSGWYSDKYDTPAVLKRLDALGMDPDSWSELRSTQTGEEQYEQAAVAGLWMNDLERRYDNIEDPRSSGLEHVAGEELGMEWKQYSKDIDEVWQEDIETMLLYNAHDVIATMEVDRSADITSIFRTNGYITGAPGSEVEQATRMIDRLAFFTAEQDEKLPRKQRNSGTEIGGGKVFLPDDTGVIKNVVAVDLSKIYPAIIISANLSKEMYAGRNRVVPEEDLEVVDGDENKKERPNRKIRTFPAGEPINVLEDLWKKGRMNMWDKLYDIQSDGTPEKSFPWHFEGGDDMGTRYPNGVRVIPSSKRKGIIPRLLDDMFELRFQFERKMAELQEDDPDFKEKYDYFDVRKSNAKRKVNAVYGAMLYPPFRLYQAQLAETVTFMGRNLLKMCKEVVESKFGYPVVYGDTDSIFIALGDDVDNVEDGVEIGHEIGEYLNTQTMNDFAHNFCQIEGDDHLFEMEFEKFYSRMFIGDKKKRYAGNKVWSE